MLERQFLWNGDNKRFNANTLKHEVESGAIVAAVEGPEQKLEASRVAKHDDEHTTAKEPSLPEGLSTGSRPVFLQKRFRERLSQDASRSQQWLNRRLEDISPLDFNPEGVIIYATRRLRCPDRFEQVWRPITSLHCKGELSPDEEQELIQAPVVLVFANLLDDEQMRGALGLSSCMSALGAYAPPMILVPHSSAPSESTTLLEDDNFKAAAEAICDGIDDVLFGEPESFELAFEVQNRVLLQAKSARNLNVELQKQRQLAERSGFLKAAMHDILWEYLRVRMHTGIPSIDETIGPGEPKTLANYSVGMKLGEGSFGKVFRLEHLGGGSVAAGEVLKTISKEPVKSFDSLLALKHQVDVMALLSSEKWAHPHIIKLYEVHHSDTHLLMRMQDGGHLDLYKRLRAREQKQWPVTLAKVKSIMQQLMDAVCHMHLGPKVVHRDLKPENIIISETKTDAKVYVSDFDTARIMPERLYCRGVCGTFPFFAPEVVLQDRYDPFAADFWSTAMVFLELVCCLSVLKKALSLAPAEKRDDRAARAKKEKDMTVKIYDCFQDVDTAHALLEWYVRPELKSLESTMHALSDGMLNVHPRQRWSENEVLEAAEKLKGTACPNEPRSPKEASLFAKPAEHLKGNACPNEPRSLKESSLFAKPAVHLKGRVCPNEPTSPKQS